MTASAIVLPVIIVIIVLFVWGTQRALQNRCTRKTNFKVIIVYMTFLLVALIVAEIYEQTTNSYPTANASKERVDVGKAILSDKSIPENQLITERVHEVEGELSIKTEQIDDDFIIYIERSLEDGNTVTERVYKPSVTWIGDKSYDLSEYVDFDLPVWKETEVVMPFQPRRELVFTAYQDSKFISQAATNQVRGFYGRNRMLYRIVHLVIPDNIELDIQLAPEYYVEVPRNS